MLLREQENLQDWRQKECDKDPLWCLGHCMGSLYKYYERPRSGNQSCR